MSVTKNIIDKGWVLQHRIEARFSKLPVMSFGTYLFFLSFVFLISGGLLSLYSFVFNINPWLCQPMSSCFFYLVMGFILFFVWLGSKKLVRVVDRPD
jgi:hypothetical protein